MLLASVSASNASLQPAVGHSGQYGHLIDGRSMAAQMHVLNFTAQVPAGLLQSSSLVLGRHGAARPHAIVQRALLRQGAASSQSAAAGRPYGAQPPQRRKHSLCTACAVLGATLQKPVDKHGSSGRLHRNNLPPGRRRSTMRRRSRVSSSASCAAMSSPSGC